MLIESKPLRFPRKKILFFFLLLVFFLIGAFSLYLVVSLPDVSDLKKQNPKTTALIQLRLKNAQKKGQTLRIRQQWASFGNIPQLLKNTVRVTEDASFYWHKGIDFAELKESIKKNLQVGKLARGGSTITQQLAKNLYLSTEKSLFRKIKEYLIARRLEKTLSKDRIFELYLNVIELGPGVFGVQVASQYYFGRDVGDLTMEQIVRLTAIIPRPLRTNPMGESRWLKWKCRWILGKLRLYKYISEKEYAETIQIFE
jgi:monofunctional biosynthetic peptidoglycan transglycosylase